MQTGQAIRRLNAWVRAKWAGLGLPAWRERVGWPRLPRIRHLALAAAALVVAYYGLGALLMENLDDDPSFAVKEADLLQGESFAIANAVALLDREINRYGWVANDPVFLPTAFLGDMAHYQRGIVDGVARFGRSVSDGLVAANAPDTDLTSAVERLSRPGTVWLWDLSRPLAFLGRSEDQYREGLVALQGYNVSVARGEGAFPKTPSALRDLLLAIAGNLDESASAMGLAAEKHAALFSARAVHSFYFAKGRAYAELVLFNGLARDFASLAASPEVQSDWNAAREALQAAAVFSPAFIINGSPDGALLPSHLVAEGFYLSRARAALNRLAVKVGASQ